MTAPAAPAAPSSVAPDTPTVAWDAAAYRALARSAEGDVEAVRAAARAAAARERGEGLTPVASPYTLWALLAESGEETDEDGTSRLRKRAGSAGASRTGRGGSAADLPPAAPTAAERRAALARLALAACAAHCAPASGGGQPDGEQPDATSAGGTTASAPAAPDGPTLSGPPAPPPLPIIADPEATLAATGVGRVPKESGPWGAYLASLAADLGADPSAARARRLAAPLAHVRERAEFTAGEFADEVQDAVLAAYDAAADASGWDDAADEAARQGEVAGRRAGLEAAVLRGRAERACTLAGAGAPGDAARRIAAAFPAGVALWREVLAAVVRGEVALEGAAWRRTLWGLQLAFAAGVEPAVVVTGDPLIGDAAGRAEVERVVRRR